MKLKLILYLWIINIIGGSTINYRIRKLLANNLVYFRHKNKLFQKALAEKMKSSSSYISQIENARRNITTDFLDKIAETFKIESYELLVEHYTITNKRIDQKK